MGIFGLFKKKTVEQKTPFSHDKADWQWESALEEYCNRNGIKEEELNLDELEEEVETTIWEYAGNHIAFFMIWLIQNDFFNTDELEEEELELIKDEKIGGVDFLMNYCDGVFAREFMKDEILNFVDDYYERDNRYFKDYCEFMEKEMNEVVLGTRFSWKLYHQFAPVIERAYQEYLKAQ